MEDQRSDVQRLLDAIDDLEPHVPLEVVRKLGGVLRAAPSRSPRSSSTRR